MWRLCTKLLVSFTRAPSSGARTHRGIRHRPLCENAIAIESEAKDPFGGNVYYVTMQITFPIPEFARKERNLHCDVVHVTTKWVSRLVLDHAIQTSR